MKTDTTSKSARPSVVSDLTGVLSEVKEKRIIQRFYADNPYVALGIAAATGYVVAGGLFTPFSRRLIRIGMKAVFLPVAASKLTDIGFGGS